MTPCNLGIQIESVFKHIPVAVVFRFVNLSFIARDRRREWTLTAFNASRRERERIDEDWMKERTPSPCNEWFKFIMFDVSMNERCDRDTQK
jgi:hypothetical protein